MSSKATAPNAPGQSGNWFVRNLIVRPRVYYHQVRNEMAKVTWPTKQDVKTYTIVVLVSTAIVCVLMGVWDVVLSTALRTIFNIGGGGSS